VRRLAQPEVIRSAVIAALVGALLCYPRLLLWQTRAYPVWYLEAVLFLGGIVLWAFVFAWHTEYTNRPVFTITWTPALFAAATITGILAAVVSRLFLDPSLRLKIPEDYPANFQQWVATALFSLAFGQLFLLFAPFAWLIRLTRNRGIAIVMTVLFGVAVLLLKNQSSQTPIQFPLFAAILVLRILMGLLLVLFYLRGGVILVWWCGLLIEARHLFTLGEN
jgi:hypothetical protein